MAATIFIIKYDQPSDWQAGPALTLENASRATLALAGNVVGIGPDARVLADGRTPTKQLSNLSGTTTAGCAAGMNAAGSTEILKTTPLGINTALEKSSPPKRGTQSNQTKESNNMFTKINNRRGGFTLVEIMIVVAIIALLAAIAVPGFLRARKRAQASRILNDLRLIDSAVDQYAIETNKTSGSTVAVSDWTNYLKKNTTLWKTGADLFGNTYSTQTVDSLPKVPASAWTSLSDVADASFWSPYDHN